MATTKAEWSSEASISITGLDSLADGSAVSSDAVDNVTSLKYISARLEVELTGVSASNTSDVVVAIERSSDGTNYEAGPSNTVQNRETLGIVKMNGTTQVRGTFFIKNLGTHWKVRLDNESGAALAASGNALNYRGLHYTTS